MAFSGTDWKYLVFTYTGVKYFVKWFLKVKVTFPHQKNMK